MSISENKKAASQHPLTAVVVGATGLVGKQLIQLLLEDLNYNKVVVLARRDLAVQHNDKLEQHILPFDQLTVALTEAEDVLTNAVVFCTLGTTIKKAGSQSAFRQVDYEYPMELGRMAKLQGAAKFLIVTAMGSDPNSRIFYNRVKGEVEQSLQELNLPELHIFRPSLLLGEREEVRLGERVATAAAPLMKLFLRGRLSKYKPITGRAVAAAMLAAAQQRPLDKSTSVKVYESDRIAELAKTYM
jgi:uncharacterized protein YbjT (DUF2867 family)